MLGLCVGRRWGCSLLGRRRECLAFTRTFSDLSGFDVHVVAVLFGSLRWYRCSSWLLPSKKSIVILPFLAVLGLTLLYRRNGHEEKTKTLPVIEACKCMLQRGLSCWIRCG
jgi:hypothetical protein